MLRSHRNAGDDLARRRRDHLRQIFFLDRQTRIEDRSHDVIERRRAADGAEVRTDVAARLAEGMTFHATDIGAAEDALAAGRIALGGALPP